MVERNGVTHPFPNRDEYPGRGRPSKPLVTKSAVVDAALGLVDEKGQDALSMRQLADRLGLDAVSSLYNHFKNKTEIKAAVARRIVTDIPRPGPEQVGPAWMLAAILAYRRSLIAHPRAITLVIESAPRDFARAMFDHAALEMTQGGVSPDRIMTLLDALESLAVGSAIGSTTRAASGGSTSETDKWTPSHASLSMDEEARFELVCRTLIEGLYAPI